LDIVNRRCFGPGKSNHTLYRHNPVARRPATCHWEIVKVYKDHGISGAKGRDKRPAFDALCRDAAKRLFDMVMAWSVDRLGRSLQDLSASYPSYTRCGLTYFCISKASTPRRRPVRRCFK
jgi:DNA invertase Pin-like site-specific DNA recombinase